VCVLACAHHLCSCGLGLSLVTLICACVCSCALVCGSCLGEVGARGGVWLKEVVAKHNCGCVRGGLRSSSRISVYQQQKLDNIMNNESNW
jgi:hypothetical protein